MGQLVLRYKSENPGVREVSREISLGPDEAKNVEGLVITEVLLDGKLFVRPGTEDEDRSNDR
jgi:hypothetical protein